MVCVAAAAACFAATWGGAGEEVSQGLNVPAHTHAHLCPVPGPLHMYEKELQAGTPSFKYINDPDLRVLLSAFGLRSLGQGIKASTLESSGCTVHLSFSETQGT